MSAVGVRVADREDRLESATHLLDLVPSFDNLANQVDRDVVTLRVAVQEGLFQRVSKRLSIVGKRTREKAPATYRLYGTFLSMPIEMSFGLMTVTAYLTSSLCSRMSLKSSSRSGSVRVFESARGDEGERSARRKGWS